MSTATQSVTAALEGVTTWAAEQHERRQAEVVEVESQIEKLREQIATLGEQLGSLEVLRQQLEEKDPATDRTSRAYGAIFTALKHQAALFNQRAHDLSSAQRARQDKVISGLASSPIAAKVTEYEQFKTVVEPTLAALPESYRMAMGKHHQGVMAEIERYLSAELDAPVTVDGESLELELVYGIDAPNGKPELLVCVLPMVDKAMTAWADRPEDVQTLLGARVVQAVYETAKVHGPAGAQVVCGGHQDLLAVEVDLVGAAGGFVDALPDNLHAVLASAPELAGARVRIVPRRVNLDYLLPPEIEEEEA